MPIVYVPPKAYSWPDQVFTMKYSRVYVTAFQSGVLKVGYTANPAARISQYAYDARRSGDDVTRMWLSGGHFNARTNEALLIEFCAQSWPIVPGHREYFQNGDLDLTLSFARELEFERLCAEDFGADHIESERWLNERFARRSFVEVDF